MLHFDLGLLTSGHKNLVSIVLKLLQQETQYSKGKYLRPLGM